MIENLKLEIEKRGEERKWMRIFIVGQAFSTTPFCMYKYSNDSMCIYICDSLIRRIIYYTKKGETIEENVGQKRLCSVAHVENKTIR